MNTLAPYTLIAELVKLWADKIVSLDPADPTHRIDLGIVAQDMHAFSNGLAHAVETFGPIVAAINDAQSNVSVPVANCRRYHHPHPPHCYNDHGSDFACWGEAF